MLELSCYFNLQLRIKDHSGNMTMPFDLKVSRKKNKTSVSQLPWDMRWSDRAAGKLEERNDGHRMGIGGCDQHDRPPASAH